MSGVTYEIMHFDTVAAELGSDGSVSVLMPDLMPYDLVLDEGAEDFDDLVNNMLNFRHWLASRLLAPYRRYEKEILNSLGLSQSTGDLERSEIALGCHALTLTDVFWVRTAGEHVTFNDVNLFDNGLDNDFVPVSLRGASMLAEGTSYQRDLTTAGQCPKAWVRDGDTFFLYKDGDQRDVDAELIASMVSQCFDVSQVAYTEGAYDGSKVSVSQIMTSRSRSLVTREAFEIYAANHEIDPMEYILGLDPHAFHMMNIIDYLVGNTDRHWENWGLYIDNETNRPISLHPLMDFNQSFREYDDLDGAACQTVRPRRLTQRDAALEAVDAVGLNQIREIDPGWFDGNEDWYAMLVRRLDELFAR